MIIVSVTVITAQQFNPNGIKVVYYYSVKRENCVRNFVVVMKSNSCKKLTSYVVFESFDCWLVMVIDDSL